MPTKIEKDHLTGTDTTGHEWDGLKELNTPLPKWWLYVFYATIAFSVVWMVVYPSLPIWGARGTSGWVAREALAPVLEHHRARQEPMLARIRALTPAQVAADPELRAFALAGGRIAFANTCAGCHGAGGQGAPGGYPSLADDEWIWGGSFDAIQRTILHGIRDSENADTRASVMPAYAGMLTPTQISDVAEFVLSLSSRGTDAAAAVRGRVTYEEQCVACHAANGRGEPEQGGPNLADQVWLYGGDKAAIMRQIANPRMGVMPAWGGRLDPATVTMLTVFVHALGGGQ
ncbi:MAG: cytochrome-c oxidase, cbb3-type subunit III [Acetobacteraceae bacterium]|nr:cytochrome-c oxidase, cbb3-type subunit III [Acetobacteraceae bacterium]